MRKLQKKGRNPTVLTRAIPSEATRLELVKARTESQSHRTDQGNSEENSTTARTNRMPGRNPTVLTRAIPREMDLTMITLQVEGRNPTVLTRAIPSAKKAGVTVEALQVAIPPCTDQGNSEDLVPDVTLDVNTMVAIPPY